MYCYFRQLALLYISLSVKKAKSCQCNLLSEQSNSKHGNDFNSFSAKIRFTVVTSFQHFAIKFLNQKRFLTRLKSASKSSLSWREKCDVFLLELCLAIDPSNLASKNDVTELSEFQMLVKITSRL